ncbi:hypothetical protein ACIQH0_32730 [Streptomyces griseus]|uniref:hypothetical protein n=1 Tax=Streptomyces griseus TaxID=1911 RepID=UPI003815AED3
MTTQPAPVCQWCQQPALPPVTQWDGRPQCGDPHACAKRIPEEGRRAALTPPAGLCGCGRPDPGPCTPCPHRSTSLHCACVCTPQGAA